MMRILKGGGESMIDRYPQMNSTAYGLTPREKEIEEYVLRGVKSGEIARILGVKLKTISTAKLRIKEKRGSFPDVKQT